MYGMVNKSVHEFVQTNFGKEKWEQIRAKAGVEDEVFISNQSYPDELTGRLVAAAADILDTPMEKILEGFGEHWVLQTAQRGYGDLLDSSGRTLREFLINLPNFHAHVALIFPRLAPPQFAVTDVTENSMHLHYYSHRAGLQPFVVGLIRGLGQKFKTRVDVELSHRRTDEKDHDVFCIRWTEEARS